MEKKNTQFQDGLSGTTSQALAHGICSTGFPSILKKKLEMLTNLQTEIWFYGRVQGIIMSVPLMLMSSTLVIGMLGKISTTKVPYTRIGSITTMVTPESFKKPTSSSNSQHPQPSSSGLTLIISYPLSSQSYYTKILGMEAGMALWRHGTLMSVTAHTEKRTLALENQMLKHSDLEAEPSPRSNHGPTMNSLKASGTLRK